MLSVSGKTSEQRLMCEDAAQSRPAPGGPGTPEDKKELVSAQGGSRAFLSMYSLPEGSKYILCEVLESPGPAG